MMILEIISDVKLICLLVDKVTTDEELEEMLQRDNLAIFISDVSKLPASHLKQYTL